MSNKILDKIEKLLKERNDLELEISNLRIQLKEEEQEQKKSRLLKVQEIFKKALSSNKWLNDIKNGVYYKLISVSSVDIDLYDPEEYYFSFISKLNLYGSINDNSFSIREDNINGILYTLNTKDLNNFEDYKVVSQTEINKLVQKYVKKTKEA